MVSDGARRQTRVSKSSGLAKEANAASLSERPGEPVASQVAHLFRHESGRITATVARIFGLHNLALAEDVVQDAFFRALEVWKIRGMPDNPAAWLMTAAKNRALDALRRERTVRTFAPELDHLLRSEWTAAPVVAEEFGPLRIKDDLLRMMFSCCNPTLSEAAQLAVILNILCGFTAAEIAAAFLSPLTTVEKRLARAKKSLAATPALFDIADAAEFEARLPTVLRALYLLFNEGYHGSAGGVRPELCHEAMRLADLLLDHPLGRVPAGFALAALMCFNAARLPARAGQGGNLIALVHQDRSSWDCALIARGLALLDASRLGARDQRISCRSRHRLGPCRGGGLCGHRLAQDHRALRYAADIDALAGGGAQSRHRGGGGRRTRARVAGA
jgi:RNA polymerase sigma factor (sigma-70 family)